MNITRNSLFRGVPLDKGIKDAVEKGRTKDNVIYLDLSAGVRDPLRAWPSSSLIKKFVSQSDHIVEIDLSGNALKGSLSDGFGLWQYALGSLKRLDVSRCQLRSLRGIEILSALKVCMAGGNVISCLAKTVPTSVLETLDLSGNGLWNLGDCIEMCSRLPMLRHLSVRGNPLCEHVRDWKQVLIYSLLNEVEDRLPFFLDGEAVTAKELEMARLAIKGDGGYSVETNRERHDMTKTKSEEENDLKIKNAALEALLLQAAGRQDAAVVALAQKEAQLSHAHNAMQKKREFVLVGKEQQRYEHHLTSKTFVNTPLQSDQLRVMASEARLQLVREKNRLEAARRRLLCLVGALAQADAASGDEINEHNTTMPHFSKNQIERALASLDDVDPEPQQRCLRDSLSTYRHRLEVNLELAKQVEQVQATTTKNLASRAAELSAKYELVLQQEAEAVVSIPRCHTTPTAEEEDEEEEVVVIPRSIQVNASTSNNLEDTGTQCLPSTPHEEKQVQCTVAQVQTASTPAPAVVREERWRDRPPHALVPDCDYILGEDGTGLRVDELLRGASSADLELRISRLRADRERIRRTARLELNIISARDLPPMKHSTQTADCYAVASLTTISGICHKRKTQVVRDTRFPEWRQSLVLPAPKSGNDTHCTIEILHRPRIGEDEHVAQASLDLEPLYHHQHWTKRWLRLHQVQSVHSTIAKRRRLTARSAVRVEARIIHDPKVLLDRAIAIVENHLRNMIMPLASSTPDRNNNDNEESIQSQSSLQKKKKIVETPSSTQQRQSKSQLNSSSTTDKSFSFGKELDPSLLNVFRAPHNQQRTPNSSSSGGRPPWRSSGHS